MDKPVHPEPAAPRPDWLRLDLTTSANSQIQSQGDEVGWELWSGRIVAGWDCAADPSRAASVAAHLAVDVGEELWVEGHVTLPVGDCELWLLRLGELHPVVEDQVDLVTGPISVFDAADAISQDLADVVGPLVFSETDQAVGMFLPEVDELTDGAWLEQLLILRSISVVRPLRGCGVGAWAAARALTVLARDEGTLVALLAAPLSRSAFLRDHGFRDTDAGPLGVAEKAAWDRASAAIGDHWRRTLGLQPVKGEPRVLVGVGGTNDARSATLRRWR